MLHVPPTGTPTKRPEGEAWAALSYSGPRTSPLFGGNGVLGPGAAPTFLHFHATPPRVAPHGPTATFHGLTVCRLGSLRGGRLKVRGHAGRRGCMRPRSGATAAQCGFYATSLSYFLLPCWGSILRTSLLVSLSICSHALFSTSTLVAGTRMVSRSSGREEVLRQSARCTPPSLPFHPRRSDPLRRGKLSQIFPQRVSRASARRHRKTVFPHLSECAVSVRFTYFSGRRFHRFSLLQHFAQTQPRLRRTVLTLSCWFSCTARASPL